MNRKNFIKTCGFACISSSVFVSILESCGSSKIFNASIAGSDLIVPLEYFIVEKNGEKSYRKYVIVSNESLEFPICVYRFSESEFTALWMKCTHQGAELQVFGDKLQCPAHGSEFTNKGILQNGPADQSLREFPIRMDINNLKITLR